MLRYFGFISQRSNNMGAPLAGKNKVLNIAKFLESIDNKIQIISFLPDSRKIVDLSEQIQIRHIPRIESFSKKNKTFLKKLVDYIYYKILKIKTFLFLLFEIKRNEILIVYHATGGYTGPLRWAKRFKKYKIILEVEEIYADVDGKVKTRKNEEKMFLVADGFVFPTELLNEKVNRNDKPYAIVYGNGDAMPVLAQPFADGKIHLVYAGTFDPRKGGVAAVVAVAELLPENYHIHILGFGTEQDKKILLDSIEQISSKSKCTITYDGLLSGNEFTKFLQSCHIGLSTQNSKGAFNETSFPSKTLVYLANGLRVVSVRLKVLEQSGVNDLIYYYDDDDPEQLAKAIRQIDITQPYDSRQRVRELNEDFKIELKNLIEKLKSK